MSSSTDVQSTRERILLARALRSARTELGDQVAPELDDLADRQLPEVAESSATSTFESDNSWAQVLRVAAQPNVIFLPGSFTHSIRTEDRAAAGSEGQVSLFDDDDLELPSGLTLTCEWTPLQGPHEYFKKVPKARPESQPDDERWIRRE